MLYDLNVPWSPTTSSSNLERTISFLSELGYHTLALNHTLSTPLPPQLTNAIPLVEALPFKLPPKTVLLRRATLPISDPSQNHRMSALASTYDIFALRPTTEKAFLAACLSLTEHSIISLDLTKRYPFHFKPKPLMTAVNRGVFIEICYAQAVGGDGAARKNFISNVMAIVRCTRGRGLVVSSEARSVLGCRGPADVVNLLGVWGLSREKGDEGLGVNPRGVVVNEQLKRRGWRGIVDVVDGGESLMPKKPIVETAASPANGKNTEAKKGKGKRPAEDANEATPPMSKRAAKKARLLALKESKEKDSEASTPGTDTPKTPLPPESSGTPTKSKK